MEAAVGVCCEKAQEMVAEGVQYTPLWLHTALDMFYLIEDKAQRQGKLEKRSQKSEVKNFNAPTFF